MSILTPEQLEPNDGGEMVMGLAKVGQHAKEKGFARCSQKKHHLLITSVFLFLFVCLIGEDEDGGRVKTETALMWQ